LTVIKGNFIFGDLVNSDIVYKECYVKVPDVDIKVVLTEVLRICKL